MTGPDTGHKPVFKEIRSISGPAWAGCSRYRHHGSVSQSEFAPTDVAPQAFNPDFHGPSTHPPIQTRPALSSPRALSRAPEGVRKATLRRFQALMVITRKVRVESSFSLKCSRSKV